MAGWLLTMTLSLKRAESPWEVLSVYVTSVREIILETRDLFLMYHKPPFFLFCFSGEETSVEERSFCSFLCISVLSVEKKLLRLFVVRPRGKKLLLWFSRGQSIHRP